jgi:hypothetical protein
VDEQHRQPTRVADRLPIDLLVVPDVKHPLLVRLNRRVLVGHGLSIARPAADARPHPNTAAAAAARYSTGGRRVILATT